MLIFVMKIALCTEVLYPVYGVEKRVLEMARRLPKYGFDVDVFTSTEQKYIPDVNIIQTSKPTIVKPPVRNYAFLMQYWFNTFKKINKTYDLIDANGHPTLIPCSLASIKTKKPVIATIHDLYLGHWNEMYKSNFSFVGEFLEFFSAKMPFNKVLTLNSTIRRKMIETLNIAQDKLTVLPSGIDVKEIDQVKNQKRRDDTILYVGRLTPQKDVGTLIKAFSMMDKNYELRIVGEGSEKEKLINISKALNVLDRISFVHPYKSHEDMIKEIKSATLLAIPSLRECFGIVPLEAMACSTPVVSTKTEGPIDYIEDGKNSFLCDIGSAESMSEKLRICLESNRNKISVNARKTALAYDWEVIVKRIANEYWKILG